MRLEYLHEILKRINNDILLVGTYRNLLISAIQSLRLNKYNLIFLKGKIIHYKIY